MDRPSLPKGEGMLFVYPEERYLRFWMRNTLFPMDILFLDASLKVVDMQRMVPEPGVPPGELTVYSSAAPARYALEVNAGRAQTCDMQVGALATVTGLAAH